MKEIYLQRTVEIQPCFNRDVLRELADKATTARLDLEAWAEGENIQYAVCFSNAPIYFFTICSVEIERT